LTDFSSRTFDRIDVEVGAGIARLYRACGKVRICPQQAKRIAGRQILDEAPRSRREQNRTARSFSARRINDVGLVRFTANGFDQRFGEQRLVAKQDEHRNIACQETIR
jgi:hypothetical protein